MLLASWLHKKHSEDDLKNVLNPSRQQQLLIISEFDLFLFSNSIVKVSSHEKYCGKNI